MSAGLGFAFARIGPRGQSRTVEDIPVTTADLLDAWRDAHRAADLAARLTRVAEATANEADADAIASTEIAEFAERAAIAANEAAAKASDAAAKARAGADRAASLAASKRSPVVGDARHNEQDARTVEDEARHRFEDAEAAAQQGEAREGTANLR